jgi:hypothetical protein
LNASHCRRTVHIQPAEETWTLQTDTQVLVEFLQDDKAAIMGRQSSPPGADMVAALSKAGFSGEAFPSTDLFSELRSLM